MSSSHPQPSLPPSPVEEDISHADTWADEEDSSTPAAKTSALLAVKKEKERAWRESSYEGVDENDMLEPADATLDEYPPSKEEEAETRRVQEVCTTYSHI